MAKGIKSSAIEDYIQNNLEELEEIQVLTNRYLESINHEHMDIEIEDDFDE